MHLKAFWCAQENDVSEYALIVAHGGQSPCEYEITPQETMEQAITAIKERMTDQTQMTCYLIRTPTAREPVKVTEAQIVAAGRVVAERAGEDWDAIGDFAREVIADTQRAALTAALATVQPAEPGAGQEIDRTQPWIVCAAIRFPDGRVIVGARHWDRLMHQQADMAYRETQGRVEQGFIDQREVFYDRKAAWLIAKANGQIRHRCGGDETDGGTLYSENLY